MNSYKEKRQPRYSYTQTLQRMPTSDVSMISVILGVFVVGGKVLSIETAVSGDDDLVSFTSNFLHHVGYSKGLAFFAKINFPMILVWKVFKPMTYRMVAAAAEKTPTKLIIYLDITKNSKNLWEK